MSYRRSVVATTVALVLMLAACRPQVDVPLTGTPASLPPRAVVAAAEHLSAALEIPVEDIEIISYEHTKWPNTCLGLAEPGELCAEVITYGWQVVLRAEGEQYVFRTDETGKTVRREE